MTSVLTRHQTKTRQTTVTEDGREYLLIVTLRYDDSCGNGHNTFAITGERWRAKNGQKIGRDCEAAGCLHDDIARHFPDLSPYIRWHLTSSDGPMHYIENTAYWVGRRGYTDGKQGSPPNLTHARSSAVWPDATDEELTAPGLEMRLQARWPKLMEAFRQAVESLGWTY